MSLFLKNISFHGVVVENLMEPGSVMWQYVHRLMKEGLQNGTVQPLQQHNFSRHQLEKAFRFVAEGEHIGKVLIKVLILD